ncbi:hypothetical protein ACJ73_08142, partial [Blastomyces percursus]
MVSPGLIAAGRSEPDTDLSVLWERRFAAKSLLYGSRWMSPIMPPSMLLNDHLMIRVTSQPSSDALLAFKHELEMQRLFEKDPMIRTLVDFIPEIEHGGPMMVLEAFTDSLWEARNARPFTAKEIKWIMK